MSSQTTVGFVLYPDCTLLDFAGATQVFTTWTTQGQYRSLWLAPQVQPILTSEGTSVLPSHSFDKHPPIDILFVPGGGTNGLIETMNSSTYKTWLRKRAPQAQWRGSICVGAFILAAAGLLDGSEATTYWSQIPNLKLFKTFKVPDGYPRWVIDERQRIFTGGGVSSSIDLALELVNRISGADLSQAAQLSIQYAPDPPFKSGDPNQAPPGIVKQVLKGQEKTFIRPVREAVKKIVGGG